MGGSLVVQTSFLGDVILTTPLIAELAKRGPVDVVATPEGAAVLANNPAIRQVIRYDKTGSYSSALGMRQTVRQIRRKPPYGVVYLAQGSLRSGLLAVLTGAPQRIGFASSTGRMLYTTQLRFRPEKHHAERLWSLSMSECADPPVAGQVRPRLYPSDEDHRAVDSLLRLHGDSDVPFIALAPGSAWGTKRWPYYRELAALIARDHRLAIVGSASDADTAAAMANVVSPNSVINAVGRLSLLASAALIGRARAIVTNDSAPLHLASAMGTPTISIFGPTVPEFGFGPLAARRAVIGHESLGCRPCHRHGPESCPLGHWKCMRDVPATRVAGALDLVLNPSVAA
ncbi:MAG TPA: lipopolysaccharide heptosyltransferase II [Gemmatimonadaceae bacterium]|nr:lipopolysaccharide heptosyltransferase II [Gemmatimonadaceae bacterium]